MKKLITITALLISVLSLTSCLRDATPIYGDFNTKATTSVSESVTLESSASETESPIEIPPSEPHAEVMKWVSRYQYSDALIMSAEDIEKENQRMAEISESIVDIFSFGDTVSAEELKGLVDRHKVPTAERYDADGNPITEEHKNKTRDLMKLGDTKLFDVQLGIMTSRGNLRAIPDEMPYRKSTDNPYDSVQLTELSVGTPILVLFTTTDGEYYFIVSRFYSGWMKVSDVALCSNREHWTDFASPDRFICITDALYRNGDLVLDMGTVLPLKWRESSFYRVSLPVRTEDGVLDLREIRIERNSASEGYLSYTYENYLTQAFKYEGTEYGWGGLNDGIDCSGFVKNVFGCFGFCIPRDTKDQNKVVGSAIDVTGKSHADIAGFLEAATPTAVYYPGHTLLYIGYDSDEGKYYFIHAPKIGETVTVTAKTDLAGMTYIGKLN